MVSRLKLANRQLVNKLLGDLLHDFVGNSIVILGNLIDGSACEVHQLKQVLGVQLKVSPLLNHNVGQHKCQGVGFAKFVSSFHERNIRNT
jgi:hypothetical protein